MTLVPTSIKFKVDFAYIIETTILNTTYFKEKVIYCYWLGNLYVSLSLSKVIYSFKLGYLYVSLSLSLESDMWLWITSFVWESLSPPSFARMLQVKHAIENWVEIRWEHFYHFHIEIAIMQSLEAHNEVLEIRGSKVVESLYLSLEKDWSQLLLGLWN